MKPKTRTNRRKLLTELAEKQSLFHRKRSKIHINLGVSEEDDARREKGFLNAEKSFSNFNE